MGVPYMYMKYIIFIAIVACAFSVGFFADASIKLIKGVEFGRVGMGSQEVKLYRVVDDTASTTCYVSTMGQWGAHSISCVK